MEQVGPGRTIVDLPWLSLVVGRVRYRPAVYSWWPLKVEIGIAYIRLGPR